MNFKTFSCPNCGANYNPSKYQCEYCGSYIFMSNENYKDFSNINIELPKKIDENTNKYPGIYVYGRLLGKKERPITLGDANYFTGVVSAGGKLLLTNKSLSFSAHAFNVGNQETRIELNQIEDVKLGANMLISQNIIVTTNEKKHKFVVYHGKEWVEKIKEAISNYSENQDIPTEQTKSTSDDYINELQRLKKLLDEGIITEEEFNIKKRMLLKI